MRIQVICSTYNRPNMLANAVRAVANQGVYDIDMIIHFNTPDGSTVKVANYFKQSFDFDIQIGICDDMEMQEGFITNIIKCFADNFPDLDGVVGTNQINIPDGCQCASSAIGRKYADRFPNRQTACPNYHHFGIDVEFMEYSKSVGKYMYCPEAKIYHHHPAHSDTRPDETYRSLRRYAGKDHQIQAERKARGYLWGRDFNLIEI